MSTPFLGEIRIMSFNYATKGWTLCNGQLQAIAQNQALFSLLGTMYGGDGRTTFALPNLQGQVPMHVGSGYTQGNAVGEYNHTLTISETSMHTHIMAASNTSAVQGPTGRQPSNTNAPAQAAAAPPPGTPASIYGTGPVDSSQTFSPAAIGNTGGSQAHFNQQPYLTLNFCIALQGIFPSQN
jgi:microcystin-dependent protein